MLAGNRELMDKLAAHLIEKETISGKEFMKIYRAEKGIPEPEEKKEEADNTEESGRAAKLEEETEAELKAEERTPEDFLRQEPTGDEGENGSRGIFSGARK